MKSGAVFLASLLLLPAVTAVRTRERVTGARDTKEVGVCPPQTKLFTSSDKDGAGNPVFQAASFASGDCVRLGTPQVESLKFCGPGNLTVSRMTCQSHLYK